MTHSITIPLEPKDPVMAARGRLGGSKRTAAQAVARAANGARPNRDGSSRGWKKGTPRGPSPWRGHRGPRKKRPE